MNIEEQSIVASKLDRTCMRSNLKVNILDDNLLVTRCQHGYSKPKSPTVNLGALDGLPLELLQMVLSQLDLRSLEDFRRVNRRAIQVVESIPQYKVIMARAPFALHAILNIGTGEWMTCGTLYDKLCTAQCEQCGDFGGYLYILTCERVCFLCFTKHNRYLPLSHNDAIRKFGLNRQILKTLPSMKSVPGMYSRSEKRVHTRHKLVDSEFACRAGVELHGSADAMAQFVSDVTTQKLREYDKRASRIMLAKGSELTSYRPRRPRTDDVFDGQSRNPMRFVAIIRMPWLDRVSKTSEWGFFCIGCERCHCSLYRRGESFSEHIRQCGH